MPCMHPRYKATHLGFVWVTWVKESLGYSQGFLGTWVKGSLGCTQGFLGTWVKEILQCQHECHKKNQMHGLMSMQLAYVVLMQLGTWLSWSKALITCWHEQAMPCMHPRYKATHLGFVWVTWVKVSLGCSQGFLGTWGKEILPCQHNMSQNEPNAKTHVHATCLCCAHAALHLAQLE